MSSNPYITETESKYFDLPLLVVGAAIAVFGTMVVKFVSGLVAGRK